MGVTSESRRQVFAPDSAARRRSIAQVASVVMCVAGITFYVQLGSHPKTKQPTSVPGEPSLQLSSAERKKHEVTPTLPSPMKGEGFNEPDPPAETSRAPAPVPAKVAEPPAIDQAAVASAEAGLDAASRDRARADDRAAIMARRLSLATGQAALDAARARKLAFVVRDPSSRVTQASTRGGFLRGEREKIQKELTTLRQLPRPKSASILSKAPVSKPAFSDEFHFELRHERITFINLERLMELTRADAQVRIRMSDRSPSVSNKVGPVGAFSLEYELVRAVPGTMEEVLQRKNVRFELSGWELRSELENRGETFESTRGPLSEYSRTTNRLTPGRATVTLWVYPDSFILFRKIRGDLTDRGFSVAARPLPEGMTIRGSPMGTQSAAQ